MTPVRAFVRAALPSIGAIALTLAPVPVQPALAHEFAIVVVASDTAASADARRGFRLAVDESPDVSHPRGQDGGDHLGGVDVDIVRVQAAADADATAARVDALLDQGAAAVVTLAADAQVQAVSGVAAGRGALHIVVTPGAGSADQQGALVLRPRAAGRRDRALVEAFRSNFAGEYGAPPAPAALLGYDAGRLLDALVGRFGERLQPGPRMAAAARRASGSLAGTDVDVGPVQAGEAVDVPVGGTPSGGVAGEPARTDRPVWAVPVLAVAGVLIAGGAAVATWWCRQRRRSDGM